MKKLFLSDLWALPIYISLLVLIIFFFFKSKNDNKFLLYAIILKIIGGLIFSIVYIYVYGGGDAWAYFFSAKAIGELLLKDFSLGWEVISGFTNPIEAFDRGYFDIETGYPAYYMMKDSYTFAVCRYTSIFYLFGNSYLTTNTIVSTFSFVGLWKFFKMVKGIYPENDFGLFVIIFCIPSLLFWGGGIMKDTYVLSATCWVVYNFHRIFILRKKIFSNIFLLVMNFLIIATIKPYIIISLIPGMLIWFNSAYLRRIDNFFLKLITIPILALIASLIGFLAFSNLESFMGKYTNVDSAINQAQIIQQDLLREDQYGSNNYNLGEIDGSVVGIIKLAPAAILTAFFRPFPWEIGSPIMIVSVIENVIFLIYFSYVLISVRPYSFIKIVFKKPFILFCMFFSLIFAFGVGVASTNFGALVRYKIPLIPFFYCCLFLIHKINNKKDIYLK